MAQNPEKTDSVVDASESSGGIHHLGCIKQPFKSTGVSPPDFFQHQQYLVMAWGNSVDLVGVFLVPANCSTLLRQAGKGGGIFGGLHPGNLT